MHDRSRTARIIALAEVALGVAAVFAAGLVAWSATLPDSELRNWITAAFVLVIALWAIQRGARTLRGTNG